MRIEACQGKSCSRVLRGLPFIPKTRLLNQQDLILRGYSHPNTENTAGTVPVVWWSDHGAKDRFILDTATSVQLERLKFRNKEGLLIML